MDELKAALKKASQKLGEQVEPQLSRPDEQFGDYSTNLALQLAQKLGKNPHEVAEAIKTDLAASGITAEIAGPGFLNFKLPDETLAKAAFNATDLPKPNAGQEILVEFGDPNPFKEMHIGHVYSYTVGDAIASLLEVSGAKVKRLSYHGDVGLHVAKTIWAINNKASTAAGFQAGNIETDTMMGGFYAIGNKAYEADEIAKVEIERINQKIYDKSDPKINELYEWGRQKSFAYFDNVLKDLDVHSAERFLESEAAIEGKKMVEANIGKVFEKSDGAMVYKGEKVGLHTRVFITSAGLPTYEAKDLGLAKLKPKANRSLIVTAHEQTEYFKVMLAALAEIDKDLAAKTEHIYHGFVSLSSGKMSSRTGEVYSALSFIMDVDEAVEKAFEKTSDSTRNAAIKYGFLKHRLGSDIVYDVAESISLEGNSGPYLQYAHARAKSILSKAQTKSSELKNLNLEPAERSLARKISEYPEVVAAAITELLPSHICTYLYELAQNFNAFYENSRVIGDTRQELRLKLVEAYAAVLKSGLNLLNIEAPEKV